MRLRPVEVRDVGALHALWIDPDVRRYLWDDDIIARKVAVDAVARSRRQFAESGHGLWLALPLNGNDIVGFCGFWYFREPPQLELLYGVAPSHWHRGFACEMARAMLEYGFATLGFERILGTTDAGNTASARVMEKIGMRFERREERDDKDTVFYSIRRDLG